MRVRFATTDDKEALLELMAAKVYPPSTATDVSSEARRDYYLKEYDTRWQDHMRRNDSRLIVAEKGRRMVAYLHLGLNQKSGLTGDMQSRVLDHGGLEEAYPEMVEAALAVSRQSANKYLTTRVYCSDPAERAIFQRLGFNPEITRVVRRTAEINHSGPFALRVAQPGDRLFIATRNARSSLFYLYANRNDDADSVASRNFAHYLGLDLTQPEKFLATIVENEDGPVGYVLLQNYWEMDVSGASGSYIYDVVVDPKFWGSAASGQISHYSHSLLHRMGREFVFGDISFDNSRTLKWCVRRLGYTADWERWAKPVGSWEFAAPKTSRRAANLEGQ